jgi:membrane-bound metal-dependent hydrolase YbcI (DUF457 family)
MRIRSHALVAAASVVGLAPYWTNEVGLVGVAVVAAVAGALLPDQDLMRPWSWWLAHRGPAHTPWLALFVTTAVGLLVGPAHWPLALLVGYGVLTHLVLDSLTPMGVMWGWPVTRRRWRGPIRTGSWQEDLACLGWVVLVGVGGPLLQHSAQLHLSL